MITEFGRNVAKAVSGSPLMTESQVQCQAWRVKSVLVRCSVVQRLSCPHQYHSTSAPYSSIICHWCWLFIVNDSTVNKALKVQWAVSKEEHELVHSWTDLRFYWGFSWGDRGKVWESAVRFVDFGVQFEHVLASERSC